MLSRFRAWLVLGVLGLSSCNGRVVHRHASENNHDTPDPAVRDNGDPCSRSSQCASGVCSVNDTEACGICVEAPALGTACEDPSVECGADAVCLDGVCQTNNLPLGATCTFTWNDNIGRCGSHAWCRGENKAGEDGPGSCTPRPAVGESCSHGDSPCDAGAACQNGVCILDEPRKLGESCIPTQCEPGLYCRAPGKAGVDTICHEPGLQPGAACGDAHGVLVDDICVAGTVCADPFYPDGSGGLRDSTCLPLPLAGESCFSDHCAPGLACEPDPADITWPTCIEPHAEGEPCVSYDYAKDSVCQAGLECRHGFCRPACN